MLFQPKIFDGTDRAHEMQLESFRALILWQYESAVDSWKRARQFHLIEAFHGWNGHVDEAGAPALAYVSGGRWLAKCPNCAGIEYVARDDRILFCHSCENPDVAGSARRVVFHDDYLEIEKVLLKRPVMLRPEWAHKFKQIDNSQLAAGALPMKGLRLDWFVGQTLEQLIEENSKAGL